MHKDSQLTPRIIAAIEARKLADKELRAAIEEAFPAGSAVYCKTSRMKVSGWRTVVPTQYCSDPFLLFVEAPQGRNQEIHVDHHLIQPEP